MYNVVIFAGFLALAGARRHDALVARKAIEESDISPPMKTDAIESNLNYLLRVSGRPAAQAAGDLRVRLGLGKDWVPPEDAARNVTFQAYQNYMRAQETMNKVYKETGKDPGRLVRGQIAYNRIMDAREELMKHKEIYDRLTHNFASDKGQVRVGALELISELQAELLYYDREKAKGALAAEDEEDYRWVKAQLSELAKMKEDISKADLAVDTYIAETKKKIEHDAAAGQQRYNAKGMHTKEFNDVEKRILDKLREAATQAREKYWAANTFRLVEQDVGRQVASGPKVVGNAQDLLKGIPPELRGAFSPPPERKV